MSPLAPFRLSEAGSLAKASTPEPFSKSRTSNWVARAGGLPPYVQHIAHDLMEDPKHPRTESEAIKLAVGIIEKPPRNWGAEARAAAAKALAEWQAKRGKTAAAKGAKLAESKRRAASVRLGVSDRARLRSNARARLRAIEDSFGVQMMSLLLEAAPASSAFKPTLKRTASASSETNRFEVHSGGQHVGYVMSRPGYGQPAKDRWRTAGVNGRTVGEMQDSKQSALDLLCKHLEEAPARIMVANGKHLIVEPDSYNGPTRYSEYPSASAARFAAGLPEQETDVEKQSKVAELGESVAFDVFTLSALEEELGQFTPLREAAQAYCLGEGAPSGFEKGDRVNYQHSHFGRVPAMVTKVTSRHVFLKSPDPRVRDMKMTHRQATSGLSKTRTSEKAKEAARRGEPAGVLGTLLEGEEHRLDEECLAESGLTYAERKKLPKSDFVYPEKAPGPGSYPIDTRDRAIAALARASDPANSGSLADVQAKAWARYPDLKPSKNGKKAA